MPVYRLNCKSFYLGVPGVTHCLLIETDEGLVLVGSEITLTRHDLCAHSLP